MSPRGVARRRAPETECDRHCDADPARQALRRGGVPFAPGSVRRTEPERQAVRRLLDLDRRAGLLELLLDLFGLVLGPPSLTGLGAPSTRSLASLRPRPGDRAHFLDHVDLLVAGSRPG